MLQLAQLLHGGAGVGGVNQMQASRVVTRQVVAPTGAAHAGRAAAGVRGCCVCVYACARAAWASQACARDWEKGKRGVKNDEILFTRSHIFSPNSRTRHPPLCHSRASDTLHVTAWGVAVPPPG